MRFLHTMIRVKNLEDSIHFYQDLLQMRVLSKHEFADKKFTLVYIGYEDIDKGSCIELTYNWDNRDYELGSAFGHLAIEVDDLFACCEKLKRQGVEITREPGPMTGSRHTLAFIKDPDGYFIELLQKPN